MRTIALFVTVAVVAAVAVIIVRNRGPEDKSRRPSPPATASCRFADGQTLTVDYSSPRMKGRRIFGGLVPYGKVWRVGANEATTFVATTDVKVGDANVPAGAYTLFALPESARRWTLIVSRKTGEWGIPYPGEQYDFARTPMTVIPLPPPPGQAAGVENFTIALDSAGTRCTMRLEWETTRAAVDIDERLAK